MCLNLVEIFRSPSVYLVYRLKQLFLQDHSITIQLKITKTISITGEGLYNIAFVVLQFIKLFEMLKTRADKQTDCLVASHKRQTLVVMPTPTGL